MVRRFAAVLALAAAPLPAAADDWVWQDPEGEGRAGSPIRFTTRLSLWVSTYDRPSRACDTGFFDDVPVARGRLRPKQIEPPPIPIFCPHEDSDETGVGAGVGGMFRVAGPFHLTIGADVLYTNPEFFSIKPQLVVAVPFGVQITWPTWSFRPFVEATITPVLYLTDDARDFTLGGNAGFAYRVHRFGDIALAIGHQTAKTLSNWSVAFSLVPL